MNPTTPQYGKIATTEEEKATNRANLQKTLSGMGVQSTVDKGSVVPVLSSNRGAGLITEEVKNHTTEIANMAPKTGDSNPETKKDSFTRNSALENIGGVTADEAAMTGIDLNTYNYDPKSGYFLPKQSKRDSVEEDYGRGLSEIENTFAPLLKNLDATTQNTINAYKDLYQQSIEEQRKANELNMRATNTTNMRMGLSRYAPNTAKANLDAERQRGLDRIKKLNIEEATFIADAQQALFDKKYDIFLTARKEVQDLRKERTAAIKELKENEEKAVERLREDNQAQVLSGIQQILFDSSKDIEEKKQLAGELLNSGIALSPEQLKEVNTMFRTAEQDEIKNKLESDRFSWDQKMDVIKNAIDQKKLSIDEAQLAIDKAKAGLTTVVDPITGDVSLVQKPDETAKSELLNIVSITDNLLNKTVKNTRGIEEPLLSAVVGARRFGANIDAFLGTGGDKTLAINQLNQIQGLLSLESREKLKGSGAISDFEFKVLSQAASDFSRQLSPEQAAKSIRKINGVAKTAAGLDTTVSITDPKTGDTQIGPANRELINQAIADGMLVTYQ